MINSIQLKDFQRHKDKLITFDPGVNVITGESRIGKSSVFRAFMLLLLNESKKTNIVNWDAKFTEVIVDINGSTISRRKGDNKNEYEIDGLLLKSFGVEVPEEVARVTLIDEINVERQHDKYFLISMTAGELGKYFNQLVGLEEIDECFAKTTERQTTIATDLRYKKGQLKEYSDKIDDLSYLSECDCSLQALQARKKQAIDKEEEITLIEGTLSRIEDIERQEVEGLEQIELRFEKIVESEKLLANQDESLRSIARSIKKYPEQDIELGNIDDIMQRALKLKSEEKFIDGASATIKEIFGLQCSDAAIDQELELLLGELKTKAKECPTCGRVW